MDFREKTPISFFGAGNSDNGSTHLFVISRKKHENYANSAMQSLSDFRQSGVLCDVSLVADSVLSSDTDGDTFDEGVQAHRCVLAAGSNYFKDMFAIGTSESEQQTIKIHGVSHNILKEVVDFLYKGCCEVTEEEVKDITVAAAVMQIPSLYDACLGHLDVYNVFEMWSLADSHQVPDLLQCCAEYISSHLSVMLEQEEFFHLPATMVHAILKFTKINLGPKYNHHVLRDALRKWMVANKENVDQKQKLESLVDCEKLDISFHSNSGEYPSHTRTSEAMNRITEFPACFSLIAVVGGVDCGRCFPQVPEGANVVPCRGANTIEVIDTLSLTWMNSYMLYPWPIHFRTVFPSDGMFYLLSKRSDEIILHRFEPVLSRWTKVRKVQSGEAVARLANSGSHVRAMSEDGEEIFYCGSVRVRSAESGKVAFKINVKRNSVDELPNLPSPRYHHGAVVVGGDLFVIGGCTMTREPLASVLVLRKGQKEWEDRSPMSSARLGPGVAVLGDYIYAVGGTGVAECLKTVERYHISSNTWESVAVMRCPRVFPGVIAAGGCLFVFGGQSYAGTREDPGKRDVLRTCEKFDPGTDSWTELPGMVRGRCEMLVLTV